MYFSGTDMIVKMFNAPHSVPSINTSFSFPASKLKVTIENGSLMYSSFDGRSSQTPVGFCNNPIDATKEDCEAGGGIWTPYATLGNVTQLERVQLNATHLKAALDQMLAYYEMHAVNQLDYVALQDWVIDVMALADKQLAYQPGIDINARLIDAVGIQFNNQQSVSPLYSHSSPLMETYMRSSVMIQGSLIVNYSSDNKYPAQNYFKRRAFDGIKNMVRGVPFLDDKTLGELVMYGSLNEGMLSTFEQPILEITFLRDEFERYLTLNSDTFMQTTGSTSIELHDVRFISKNHSVSPSANNIIETYQFIARDLI